MSMCERVPVPVLAAVLWLWLQGVAAQCTGLDAAQCGLGNGCIWANLACGNLTGSFNGTLAPSPPPTPPTQQPTSAVTGRCCNLAQRYGIVPYATWGSTPSADRIWWGDNNCDTLVGGAKLGTCLPEGVTTTIAPVSLKCREVREQVVGGLYEIKQVCDIGFFCSVGKCLPAKATGAYCSSDEECETGACTNVNSRLTCTNAVCASHKDCKNGYFCDSRTKECLKQFLPNATCAFSKQCLGWCSNSTCTGRLGDGSACTEHAMCVGYCANEVCNATKPVGGPCGYDAACSSGMCNVWRGKCVTPSSEYDSATIAWYLVIAFIPTVTCCFACCLWRGCKVPDGRTPQDPCRGCCAPPAPSTKPPGCVGRLVAKVKEIQVVQFALGCHERGCSKVLIRLVKLAIIVYEVVLFVQLIIQIGQEAQGLVLRKPPETAVWTTCIQPRMPPLEEPDTALGLPAGACPTNGTRCNATELSYSCCAKGYYCGDAKYTSPAVELSQGLHPACLAVSPSPGGADFVCSDYQLCGLYYLDGYGRQCQQNCLFDPTLLQANMALRQQFKLAQIAIAAGVVVGFIFSFYSVPSSVLTALGGKSLVNHVCKCHAPEWAEFIIQCYSFAVAIMTIVLIHLSAPFATLDKLVNVQCAMGGDGVMAKGVFYGVDKVQEDASDFTALMTAKAILEFVKTVAVFVWTRRSRPVDQDMVPLQ